MRVRKSGAKVGKLSARSKLSVLNFSKIGLYGIALADMAGAGTRRRKSGIRTEVRMPQRMYAAGDCPCKGGVSPGGVSRGTDAAGNGFRECGRRGVRASRKRASRERERERTGTGSGSGSGSGAGDAGPMPQGANAAGVYRVRVPIFPGCCRLRGPSAARRVPVRAPPS